MCCEVSAVVPMENAQVNISCEPNWEDVVDVGERALLGVASVAMVLVGGVGNGMVVMLVLCSPAMHSAINILLATVALCDTLTMVILLPLDLASLLGGGWLLPATLCHAHAFLASVIRVESVAVLAVICVDRYVILVRRQDRLSLAIARWVIVVSLVVSVCVAAPPFVGVGGCRELPLPAGLTRCQWQPTSPGPVEEIAYAFVRFFMAYLLPLSVMIFCLASIVGQMRSNSAKVHCSACDAVSSCMELVEVASKREEPKRPSCSPCPPLDTFDLRYKSRTFSTIMILFFVFVLCHTPLRLVQLVQSFAGAKKMVRRAYPWLLWWAYIQPAVNPIIYATRIPMIREELLEMFPCLLRLSLGSTELGQGRSHPSSIYVIQH